MYGRKDLVKITTLTNLSAILRTIKKCLGTPLSLLFRLPQVQLIKLQRVQNVVVRLIYRFAEA